MKSLIIILSTLIFVTNTYAFTFRANANVYVTNTTAEIRVYNSYPRAIVCNGNAQGLTVRGNYVYAYMSNVAIMPGTNGFVYVYTNNFNPFVSANAAIYCTTL